MKAYRNNGFNNYRKQEKDEKCKHITWAASRVLTRSSGYDIEAAVIPDKPPPTSRTKRSALTLCLCLSNPGIDCSNCNK